MENYVFSEKISLKEKTAMNLFSQPMTTDLISFPGLLGFVNKRSDYVIKQHSFHSTAFCEQNFEKDNLFWLCYKRNVKRYC